MDLKSVPLVLSFSADTQSTSIALLLILLLIEHCWLLRATMCDAYPEE